MAERDHIRGLTGLRGLAAAWVLALHAWSFGGGARYPISIAGWTFEPTWFLSCGYFGVDLFFVLSGFLLSLPYHRAAENGLPTPSLSRFWRHRTRRVLPAYWLQLVVLVIVYALLGQFDRIAPANVAAHVGLVQNVFGGGPLLNPVYWSMPVEWDFYIVLPLLALLAGRIPGWLFAVLALAWSLSYRVLAYQSWFDPELARWISYPSINQLPARLDQFVYGILAAWILVRRPHWIRRPGVCLAAGIVGVIAMVIAAGPRDDFLVRFDVPWLFFHHSLLAAAFALMVLGVAAGAPAGRRLFAGPIMVWLGLISYSLYLWHYPLLEAWRGLGLDRMIDDSPMLSVIFLAVPAALLLSWLSYRCVERQFLARN
ncbi:MAG: acyltransferase [Dokdonella sp.]